MESSLRYIQTGFLNIMQVNKDFKKSIIKTEYYQMIALKHLEQQLQHNDSKYIEVIDKELFKKNKQEAYVTYFNETEEYNIDIMKVILLKRNRFEDYDYLTIFNKIGVFNRIDLFDLIVKKHPEQIEKFRSHEDNFLMIYAARAGNLKLLIKALDAGIDPLIRNQGALVNATSAGNIEIIEELIKRGANIFFENEVLLEIAVDSGNHLIVELYINRGLKITDDAFCRACELGFDKIVKVMLNHGAIITSRARRLAKKNVSKLLRKKK